MSFVLIYRWIVFLLAAGYCIRMVVFSEYVQFAGPFRFLTIWALFLSFFCASRMISLMEGRSVERWDGLVATTSVLNAMVCFLYWRLFLADPASVTRDGELNDLYLEAYLHGLGPLLQWIDATFIHRAFRRLGRSLLWLAGIIGAYVLWAELLVQRFATKPVGEITTGLPYPFLNNLELAERLNFYGLNWVVGAVLLFVFAGIAWLVRRFLPEPRVL